jgi:hypothetical protein
VLERLIDTLLYEGYALFPYTPGSAKNATPTPFGIVRPGEHLELQGELQRDAEARGDVHFLDGTGARHDLEPGEHTAGGLRVRVTLRQDGRRVSLHVENLTPAPPELDRMRALQYSLLSTHPVLYGPFRSPLDAVHGSVNTYPVLVEGGLLGAAIILPDFPQLAPESRGSLFDSTEIEEALLLHVLALSDAERDQIAEQDPVVRAMLERAVAATPDDIRRLHGRVEVRDPAPAPPEDRDVRGERQLEVDGVLYRLGDRVRLRAGDDHAAHDHLLDGRSATIERIYVDYEDKVHLCVTVDDDPGQELMRDIGRYLYFKPSEVEVA